MGVGAQDAPDRQTLQSGLEHPLPERLGFGTGDAAVDQGPAFAVVLVTQQLQVDVIEGEGQRHADPVDSGRDLDAGGRPGKLVAQRILEEMFECIHAGAPPRRR